MPVLSKIIASHGTIQICISCFSIPGPDQLAVKAFPPPH